ncbi:MAG TPA: translation elongation factor Ts [Candidatus Methylomirabilis sp.]|jgi:elongation factor Ts|nr:translation elongation factor Ts [Candidatus Methylomirabilis sp.]
MEISAAAVKELRERTGAGIMDCKWALGEAQGDFERAVDLLREKGIAAATKRSGRAASEGQVVSYIHAGGKIGVLLELNCETDFVARTREFIGLGHDLAMHVAAMAPLYVRREEVPPEVLEREKKVLRAQAEGSGKPPAVVEKMVGGRLEKFYQEVCLEDQAFVKDPARTVRDLIKSVAGTVGENVVVRRFTRYQLGETARTGG